MSLPGRLLCALLLLGPVAGCDCGDDDDSGPNDAGGDGGEEGTDSGVDGGTDSGVDSGVDSGTDSGIDSGIDSGVDGGIDGGGAVLTCLAIDPLTSSNLVDTVLTLEGEGFLEGATVRLDSLDEGASVDLGAAAVSPDGTSATVTILAGAAAPGLYVVVLVNPDAAEVACAQHQVVGLPPPTVTDVLPPFAWTGVQGDGVLSDQPVSITGTNLRNTPGVRFVSVADPRGGYDAPEVGWISDLQVSSVCPSESQLMPAGDYHVIVTNPDGLSAAWIDADTGERGVFVVSAVPPPDITALVPPRSPAADEVAIEIRGAYFQDGAVAAVLVPDGPAIDLATGFVDAATLDATIPAGALAPGTYPVRVTNPDGQFDVFYVYEATPSSQGHLDSFEVFGTGLLVPRWRHASQLGFDPFGRSHIFTTGGIGSDGLVRTDTETLEVSALGDTSPFRQDVQWSTVDSPRVPNELSTPRSGHTLVRVGRFLYAIGGSDANTFAEGAVPGLTSVERAEILGYGTRPAIHLPTPLGGDGLPIGTWYYRVSAVGTWGESLASREAQARNVSGQVEVCWEAVDGATVYNLYRSPASDGRAGSARLLEPAIAPDGLCITDTGRGIYQPAPGHVRGAPAAGAGLPAGYHTYRVTAVVDGIETVAGYRAAIEVQDAVAEGQVQLRWDPVIDGTFNVYRTIEPAAEVRGDEATFLLAAGLADSSMLDDGTLAPDPNAPAPDGMAPLPPGTLSRWTTLDATPMVEPREGLDGVVVTVPSGIDDDGETDVTYIFVVGGRPDSTGAAYSRTTERTAVDAATGDLQGWELEAELLNTPRVFYPLLSSQGQRETPNPPPPEEPPCEDFDGDGHFDPRCGDDCNDDDPTIYPGAPEVCGDGIDQDCDGEDLECDCDAPADADGDGHFAPPCGDDCDDTDPEVFPGAQEVCDDGIDQDCNGSDCFADCPVDADGDLDDVPECGGGDCNDDDPDIRSGIPENCTDTPGLCDDGVDQNCDGSDCGCLIFLPGVQRWFSIQAEPIFLIASQGDDAYSEAESGGGNHGTTTMEVSPITVPAGHLAGWTTQLEELPNGQPIHGHEALLYFDYLWIFQGVRRENFADLEPTPQTSAAQRFDWVEDGAADQVITDYQSSSAGVEIDRCYYSAIRLNSYIFLIGGNGGPGIGPLGDLERVIQ